MADARYVFAGSPELHGHHGLGNQLGRHRPDDMHAENAVAFRIGKKLHQARRIAQRPRPSVGHEGERACTIGDALGLQLLLGFAHPGDFRRCVNDPGDGIEVHVPMLSGDALRHGHALIFRLVRQHGPAHHVADGPDLGQIGAALVIDDDEAALVEHQADRPAIEPLRIRHAANGDDELVERGRLRLAGCIGIFHADVLAGRDLADLHTQVNGQPLLGEYLGCFLGDLIIDHTEEGRQRFEHGHIGPEPPPHAAHFQADHARTDDAQRLRHLGNVQCAGVAQNQLFVESGARQRARIGAGGDDDVLADHGLWLRAGNLDLPAAGIAFHEAALAVEERDLVFLEQENDAVVILLHDLVLAAQHFAQIERQAVYLDAVVGEGMARVIVVFRRLQQRLGRDAADIRTGAPQRWLAIGALPVVDAGGSEPQLRRADGGDIAAGTATDDYDIKILGHEFPVICRGQARLTRAY